MGLVLAFEQSEVRGFTGGMSGRSATFGHRVPLRLEGVTDLDMDFAALKEMGFALSSSMRRCS